MAEAGTTPYRMRFKHPADGTIWTVFLLVDKNNIVTHSPKVCGDFIGRNFNELQTLLQPISVRDVSKFVAID